MKRSRLQLPIALMISPLMGLAVAYTDETAPAAMAPLQDDELQHTQQVHLQIEALCHKIWSQLCALKSTEEAELFAPTFAQDAATISQLDRQLQQLECKEGLSAASKLFMEQNGSKIIELYILVGNEFSQIYQTNCLGSSALQQAFDDALRDGFFYLTRNNLVEHEKEYFTEQEEKAEIERLQALHSPDQDALKCLVQVQDEISAQRVVHELGAPISILHNLRPLPELAYHEFQASSKNLFVRVSHPLELTLWDIRNEYVRIASNFTTESPAFNNLANTLDELYLTLEETHYPIFAVVFDESFLADMDAAYEKQSVITSP